MALLFGIAAVGFLLKYHFDSSPVSRTSGPEQAEATQRGFMPLRNTATPDHANSAVVAYVTSAEAWFRAPTLHVPVGDALNANVPAVNPDLQRINHPESNVWEIPEYQSSYRNLIEETHRTNQFIDPDWIKCRADVSNIFLKNMDQYVD
jgi:hypothetical protein